MPARRSTVLAQHEDELKHGLYTNLPGEIVEYDPKTQMAVVQPLITDSDNLRMPPVDRVPVIFPSGGGAVMSFPIKKGEKCWISYSMFPISEWLGTDGKQPIKKNLSRSHHINECVAYVGLGTAKSNYQPHPDKVMVRNGKTMMTLDDNGTVEITGKLIVSDTITGKDFISSAINVSFNNHVHHYYWTDPGGEADSQKPQ